MKKLMKKFIVLTLVLTMVVSSLTACGKKKKETITLTIYSQLANFSGEQLGWSAKILKDTWNVVVNIVPDQDGVYETRMESGNLGDIVIWGVDADNDYTLTETEAPEGYNKLSAAVNVTVNAENGTRIGVENNAGSELPSTGGMGTTLFYALGGILVVAAVVLLVTKKRMSSAE